MMKELKSTINFSPLEHDVLQILWPDKKLRVRQIYKVLSKKRRVALSSIAVILDRLHSKNVVKREIETAKGGTRYIYYPAKNETELKITIIDSTVNKLIENFGSTAISYFDERFSKGGSK